MAPKTSYQIALEKLQLVAGQIDRQMYDTARTVLNSAHRDGNLELAEHLPGRLQHDALQALLVALDKHNISAAHAQLRTVLGELRRVRDRRSKQAVWACCVYVFERLPHVARIRSELEEVPKDTRRKRYVSAFQHVQAARDLLQNNEDLTPPELVKQITTVSGDIMIHLMKNNSAQVAVTIAADLKARGLIQD
jgi:hypothetical protein